jgi:hypothetical protein
MMIPFNDTTRKSIDVAEIDQLNNRSAHYNYTLSYGRQREERELKTRGVLSGISGSKLNSISLIAGLFSHFSVREVSAL